jgi:poly(A) polymerase
MTIDENAREAIARLRANGHQAYLAGGCVRDYLLGIAPKDWDVATSALPDEVLALFEGAQLVGAHFGVVLWKGTEIATFRQDGEYLDGRHPETVTFVKKLKLDAMRRDFTINSMYMDPETLEVIDYYGGRGDLESKVLATIGSPYSRIREDYLRIFRAARFAARFELNVDGALFNAMCEEAENIPKLAVERVRDELTKILTGPRPATGIYWLWTSDAARSTAGAQGMLRQLSNASVELALAAWMHAWSGAAEELRRLKFPKAVVERVLAILDAQQAIPSLLDSYSAKTKRLVREPWFRDALKLFQVHAVQTGSHCQELLEEDLHPAPLLTGDDLLAKGIPEGPEVGRLLTLLEDAQLERRVETKEEALRLIIPN